MSSFVITWLWASHTCFMLAIYIHVSCISSFNPHDSQSNEIEHQKLLTTTNQRQDRLCASNLHELIKIKKTIAIISQKCTFAKNATEKSKLFLSFLFTINSSESKVIWLLWQLNSRQTHDSKASHCSSLLKSEIITSHCLFEFEANQKSERKRKRYQEMKTSQYLSQKRLRSNINDNSSSTEININSSSINISDSQSLADINGNQLNSQFETWLQEKNYSTEYFDSDNQIWENIKVDTSARKLDVEKMTQLLIEKKKFAVDLHREALKVNIIASMKTIDDKNVIYKSSSYAQDLEFKKKELFVRVTRGHYRRWRAALSKIVKHDINDFLRYTFSRWFI